MLKVTRDGYVSTGGPRYYSLQQIEDAVLQAQNPALTINSSGPDFEIVSYTENEEHEMITNQKPNCNCEPALELPTTFVSNTEPTTNDANDPYDQGHLPLPSTMVRKVEQGRAKPTTNRDSEEHLVPPSTQRRTN